MCLHFTSVNRAVCFPFTHFCSYVCFIFTDSLHFLAPNCSFLQAEYLRIRSAFVNVN